MKSENNFGPFQNLPLITEHALPVSIEPNGKLTLDTDLCEDSKYWIILYTESNEEFLRILAIEPQKTEYTSISGIDLLITHWKETNGEIVQCDLTID